MARHLHRAIGLLNVAVHWPTMSISYNRGAEAVNAFELASESIAELNDARAAANRSYLQHYYTP